VGKNIVVCHKPTQGLRAPLQQHHAQFHSVTVPHLCCSLNAASPTKAPVRFTIAIVEGTD